MPPRDRAGEGSSLHHPLLQHLVPRDMLQEGENLVHLGDLATGRARWADGRLVWLLRDGLLREAWPVRAVACWTGGT